MSGTLRFGIGFENADARRQIEYARLAEELGFAASWVPEDYFFRGAFTIASALACSTSRIRIGLGVVNPFTRHPALIAMEFAALTELAPARTTLGIGAGVKAWIDQMGIDSPRPGAAIEEAVEVIRRLLPGEKVTFAGKVFHSDRIGLSFKSPRAEIRCAGCAKSRDGGSNRGRGNALRPDQSCLRTVCGREDQRGREDCRARWET